MATPLRELYADIKPSPRVRMATMLYQTGAAKTKAEAAQMVGITRAHLYNMTNLNPATQRLGDQYQSLVEDETISTSKILQKLSRKALGVLDTLMSAPETNDAIKFRAAQDLADRGPETQKTQKLQVESLSLSGEDAKALAAAMVESARAQYQFKDVGVHGLIEVDTDKAPDLAALRLLPQDG